MSVRSLVVQADPDSEAQFRTDASGVEVVSPHAAAATAAGRMAPPLALGSVTLPLPLPLLSGLPLPLLPPSPLHPAAGGSLVTSTHAHAHAPLHVVTSMRRLASFNSATAALAGAAAAAGGGGAVASPVTSNVAPHAANAAAVVAAAAAAAANGRASRGADAADDVASVAPLPQPRRTLSEGDGLADLHADSDEDESEGDGEGDGCEVEGVTARGGASLAVSASLSPVHSPSARSTPPPLLLHSQQSLVSLANIAPHSDECKDHNEADGVGGSVVMARHPPQDRKRRRSEAASMHMSEAGSLMASLLPMTTDVQTTMMRAEGAASPTSVASHCASSIAEPSLPTSPVAGAASAAHKKPRFSLTVESVGPAAPEEDGRRASKRARTATEKVRAAAAPPPEEGATGSAAAASESAPVDKRSLRKQQVAEMKRKQKQEKETYRSIMSVSTKAAPAARASRASVASAASAKSATGKAAAAKAAAPAASAVASVASSSRRRSAAAAPPAAAAAAAVPATAATAAAENDEERVSFPPLCADKLHSALFEEDGFPMFLSLASPGVDAALVSAAPAQAHTRAPSSQVLHAVRSQIYRELAEEYFGRFMKDTPDPEQVVQQAEAAEAGAAAAAAHSSAAASSAAAPAAAAAAGPASGKHHRRAKAAPASKGKGVDARSPEQLRMLFCDLFNRCEAERVPSTAGYNERADLCFVTPIDAAHQLTSFSATDVGSMMRGPAPPTLEEFQRQQRREAAQTRVRPLPINPHFDLFQYRPLVANDEYERIDDEVARAMLDKDAHPTLAPSPTLGGGATSPSPTAAGAGAAAAAAPASASQIGGAATAMDIDTQAIGASNPIACNALQSPVISVSATAVPLKTEGGSGDYSAAATAATASMQIDEVSATATPPASVKAEEADFRAAVGAPLSGSPMSPSALSSMTHGAMGVDAGVGGASASPAPGTATAPVVASLPALAHGVGMLGALDFNSPHMHSYREHWANSCFSWRFNNHNRTFSAHAYSATNSDWNDSALVSGILSGAQATFHAQLQQDEAEEEALIASHAKRSRAARTHSNKYADESKGTSSAAAAAASSVSASAAPAPSESKGAQLPHFDATGLPVIGAYSQGSAEYESLKRRIRVSWEGSTAQSLFLPHTFLRDVSPSLHKRAERMAGECVAQLAARVALPPDEVPIDDLFKLVVPGFGCGGVQLFLKVGLCVTLLHDEIGWCSALNYMLTRSRGAALWIGLNLHTASVKLSKHELRRLINGTTFNLVDLLAQLRKLGLQPSMQLQLPGTCIYSPSGQGSAHIVITVGSWVEQIAINHSISARGIRAANQFWEHTDPLLHNSALATRCVIPLLWLQQHRDWSLGMDQQLRVLSALSRAVLAEGKYALRYRDYDDPADQEVYCRKCFNSGRGRRAILFLAIDGCCPACFVDRPENAQYTHFANMIDRRLK